VSSPLGSSPDEDYHLVSIWCAQGIRPHMCEPGMTELSRIVPLEIYANQCFAAQPDRAAVCYTIPELGETDRGNFMGYYPNGFYLLMSLLTGPVAATSVILMRLLNSLIFAGGLAALLALIPQSRRANYMLGSLMALVPLGMFTVASVNPSSWAIISATLLFASAVEFVRATDRRRRIGLGILCAAAFAIGVASRADAAAYAGLAIVLAWLSTVKFTRKALIYGGVAALALIVGTVWAVSLGSGAGLFNIPPLRPEDLPSGWFQRLQELPGFYTDTFRRGLGWLDTRTKPSAWALATVSYFAAIFWGLRRVRWRKAVSLGLVVFLGAAVPVFITTARHTLLAEALQQRYFLPLMIMAAMIALAEDNPDGPELNRAQAWLIVVVLTIANSSALHTNLRRYITGMDGHWFNLNIGMQWWWTLTTPWVPPPMVFWSVGSVAFMGVLVVAVMSGLKGRDEPDLASTTARRALI